MDKAFLSLMPNRISLRYQLGEYMYIPSLIVQMYTRSMFLKKATLYIREKSGNFGHYVN